MKKNIKLLVLILLVFSLGWVSSGLSLSFSERPLGSSYNEVHSPSDWISENQIQVLKF